MFNYFDWILYFFVVIFMVFYLIIGENFDDWFVSIFDLCLFWIIGIFVIFVCYMNMMFFFRRYCLFGIYILMYIEVIKMVF